MEAYTLQMFHSDYQYFMSNGINFNDPYRQFYAYLYMTGCRFNELHNCINWNFSDPAGIVIPLSKGQGTRILDNLIFNPSVIQSNMAANEYFYFVNSSTANKILKDHWPGRPQLNTGKFLGTYIFRHMYIKQMSADQYTPADIAQHMGEVNVNNINGYINSIINI